MKAMRVREFSLDVPMCLDEVEDPRPEPGELLIRLGAAGVNPGDVAIRAGSHPHVSSDSLPCVLGGEAAGEVVDVGKGVDGFEKGHRVFGRCLGGGYAELVRLDARGTAELPEAYSYEEGAGISFAFRTAWNALVIKAEAGPGETVLVQGGAGGVGMAAIQLARCLGCRVIATVSSEEKGNFCRSLGANQVINYREEDVPSRCREFTGGHGVDVIVEIAASDNFDKDLDALRVNGRIAVVGPGTGKGPMAGFHVPALMTKDARVFGMAGLNLHPKMPGVLRRLLPLLREGRLKVHVHRAYPLAEANAAHEALLSGDFLGKVVLVP